MIEHIVTFAMLVLVASCLAASIVYCCLVVSGRAGRDQ